MPERTNTKNTNSSLCVLMFSGGRDSTLAAVRLRETFPQLVLATVASTHLVGIERVKARLIELRNLLPHTTRWLQVRQPELPIPEQLTAQTCLPCQRAYVAVGATIAREVESHDLALGYAEYQSAWPEQSALATACLRRVLRQNGLTLHLPAYDLKTKDDARNKLSEFGLSSEALEQKCSQQINNVSLNEDALKREINKWENTIAEQLRLPLRLEIETACTLADL